MTSNEARDFADSLQERVTQMGDRTGEGQYLGQCLSVIRDLASQIDALTPSAAVLDAQEPIPAPATTEAEIVSPARLDANLGAVKEDDGRGPEARVAAGE